MSNQLSLLRDSQPHVDQSYKTEEKTYKARSAAKRLSSPVIQKVDLSSTSQSAQSNQLEAQQPEGQTASTPAKWGRCRVCGSAIAIPGNDASLCSNPTRACGSSGWVTNPNWQTRSSRQGVSHE